MADFNSIAVDKLARLVGTHAAPVIIDVRGEPEELVPGSILRRTGAIGEWAPPLGGKRVVIVCEHGGDESAGAAAYLRNASIAAEILEGGFAAWAGAGLPVVDGRKLPARDAQGRTTWVTRARPKVDRIACPWLIRRFIDPAAIFLFVSPGDVPGVAERFGAATFDTDQALWGHRGELCSFDALVEDLGLNGFDGLRRLAVIVRGADTDRLDLAPQSAGLLAASLGLSRMHSDDLAQLNDGMILYDALYRWCRDAVDETHDPLSHAPRRAKASRSNNPVGGK